MYSNLRPRQLPVTIRCSIAAAALLLITLNAAASWAAPLFSPARLDFWVGRSPCIEDLNGDQVPDLAAVGGSGAAVHLGLGDGTFAPPSFYGAGDGPSSVAVEDLNGDQVLDLAVANSGSDDVAVLLGLGDGTFAQASIFGAGDGPSSIAIEDMNGDQVPDLAVANSHSDNVAVLLGFGDGTFAQANFYGAGDGPSSIAIEDLNGDQVPDLAVANYGSDNLAMMFGLGDGTFPAATFVGTGTRPVSVAVVDLNGDQVPDLAVANEGNVGQWDNGDVVVLLGLGEGNFAPASIVLVLWHERCVSVAIADLNGDQVPDLAATSEGRDSPSRSTLSVRLGLGDGTFALGGDYGTLSAGEIAVGDLNGDQAPDLTLSSGVFLGLGDGTFGQAGFYDTGTGPQSVAVGDLNGDQVQDLAVACHDAYAPFQRVVAVLLGLGDGTFAEASFYEAGEWPSSVAIEDLNGDQVPDLVVANSISDDVAVFLGLGDGTFAQPSFFGAGYHPSSVAIADLNGDQVPDLAVADKGGWPNLGDVAVLLGLGDGSFAEASSYWAGDAPTSVAIEDLNGDQVPDLAVASASAGVFPGDVEVLLGLGDGTFAPASFFDVGFGAGSIAIEDLNGDQVPDLAVVTTGSNVAVLLGLGDGTFGQASFHPAGDGGRSVAIEDLNGDQVPDLAVANEGNVAVLPGLGDGTFAQPSFYGAGYQPWFVAIEDLNGDQVPDLAVANVEDSPWGGPGGNMAVLLGVEDLATPVELSSFDAIPSGDGVTLRWTTGWERNLHGFHILRSTTAVLADATRVTSSLIPGGQQDYAFVDQEVSSGEYWYWLEETTRSGGVHHYGSRSVLLSPGRPALYMAQNSPNPFRNSTEIMFSVPAPTAVSLEVYSVTGRLVQSLLDQKVVGMGKHRLTWDGRGTSGAPVASGIYFYRLRVGNQELQKKLHLLH